jgi:hypothetical protein
MAAAVGNKYACKYSDEEINQLCEEMIDWAINSKEIHLASWTYKKFKRGRSVIYDMADTYPKIKETLEEVRELLASKMSNACYNSNESGINAVFGEKYLPIYNKDYKELLAWKAQLIKDSEKTEREIVVKVVNYSDSEIQSD